MNNTERKALVRKISYVLRAATPRQLETVWRYVKWVMFGEGEQVGAGTFTGAVWAVTVKSVVYRKQRFYT